MSSLLYDFNYDVMKSLEYLTLNTELGPDEVIHLKTENIDLQVRSLLLCDNGALNIW